MTEKQFNNLPKYAQARIKKLEADLTYYTEQKQIETDEKTPIYVVFSMFQPKKYIAATRVYVNGFCVKAEDDGSIQVMSSTNRLYVLPAYSNVIRIKKG